MDPEYQKERFVTLRIKESVAREFRKFCQEEATSQSVTLAAMLHFFARHHARPGDTLPIPYKEVEQRIMKRLNAVIGIIRKIEQSQTKPTVEILQSLFDGVSQSNTNTKSRSQNTWDTMNLEEELRRFEENGWKF